MQSLRILTRAIGLGLAVVIFVPPQIVILLLARLFPSALSRVWPLVPLWFFRCLLKIFGVRLKLGGPLPRPGTLLVANHVSWFDVLVIGAITPLSFIAKSEVKGWPLRLGRMF